MWLDAHTHLEMLETETDQVLADAIASQVTNLLTVGCHPKDFEKVCEIAEKNFPTVAATLGVHPHEAQFYTSEIENQIRQKSKQPFIRAVGEIGLDYYYNHSDPQVQREVFHKQMALACDLGLPVQIHSRDAEDDTITELKKWSGKVCGMMHCFTGSQDFCTKALDLGFYISFSGVVTFKNADALRSTAQSVPLDRIFVETDAPFLAPIPMRGKKNQPSFVVHTARKICEIKSVSEQALSEQIKRNSQKLYSWPTLS